MRILEKLRTATKNYVDDNLEDAIKDYNHALVLDGNNVFGLYALGNIHLEKKEFKEAEEYYKRVLELDSENILSRIGLSQTYLRLGKFEDASREQIKILEKTPQNINVRADLGHSYVGMKQYDDAIREYSIVINQGLTPISFGWIHSFSGQKYTRNAQICQRKSEKQNILLAYFGLIEMHHKKNENRQKLKYIYQLELFELKSKVTNFLYSLKP